MGKRHPNLPAWQWRSNPQSRQGASRQAIDLIAVALMVVAFLLLASGIFSGNASSAVIGLVTLFAAMSLQHQGHKVQNEPHSQAF
ncbi:hypothetical protein, partial [Pseudomonas weihenstephanensis]|mgnify:FL=1|uniref:hypothetical protein n=1 Tax=Pseudomonas weihenstephanensis TaxID=1608994 RepID=UPI0006547ADD